jgi:hypothetical protein
VPIRRTPTRASPLQAGGANGTGSDNSINKHSGSDEEGRRNKKTMKPWRGAMIVVPAALAGGALGVWGRHEGTTRLVGSPLRRDAFSSSVAATAEGLGSLPTLEELRERLRRGHDERSASRDTGGRSKSKAHLPREADRRKQVPVPRLHVARDVVRRTCAWKLGLVATVPRTSLDLILAIFPLLLASPCQVRSATLLAPNVCHGVMITDDVRHPPRVRRRCVVCVTVLS